MAKSSAKKNWQDLAQGVALADLFDSGKLVGHCGDELVLLVRSGTEVFAGGANSALIERSRLMQQELGTTDGKRAIAPIQHYSAIVKFISEVAKGEPDETPTSVDIFETGGVWYCQVCRGDEKTQPMGPYTKQQAEQIQDARRALIAKRGTGRIMFEQRVKI